MTEEPRQITARWDDGTTPAPEQQRTHVGFMAAITSSGPGEGVWTRRLVLFLRLMAVIALGKGLYHWAQITGFIGSDDVSFEVQTLAWQAATIFFAVIELVAAVGLWLATPWGAVVWLTAAVSTAVIELMFPTIYGGSVIIALMEFLLLAAYLVLAWLAARERPS